MGKDITIEALLAKHDLVFVGVGLGATGRLGVPGDDAPHVREALGWIEEMKAAPAKAIRLDGKRVLVIGGGNTAIDAVTQALCLGAHATLAYRRSEKNMSAYHYEIELARAMGCYLLFEHVPQSVEADGIVFKTPLGEDKLRADLILPAIGQQKRTGFLSSLPGVTLDEKGRVKADSEGRTTNPRIFAAGDCVSGGSDAVNAVGEAKRAARAMHAVLRTTP